MLGFVLCAVGLGACASDEPDPRETRNGTTQNTRALDFSGFDDAVEAAIANWNDSAPGQAAPVRGASIAIDGKTEGTLHSQGYGEFAADRLYLLASASKILSVGVMMRLQDQGKLDIDRPISEYLGDWGEHKPNVTLAQLVSNSAGMPDANSILAGIETEAGKLRYAAHLCEWSAAGTLADCGKSIYQDDTPENNLEPDKVFRYGGSQWQLAGAVAEKVGGQSWTDLVHETYEPCDVASLGYTNQSGITEAKFRYPPSFEGDVADAPATDNPLVEGGAYMTAPDFAKILRMHMRSGQCGDTRVLSEEAVAQMQTDRVAAYGGMPGEQWVGYGLGWWIAKDYIADGGAYGAVPAIGWRGRYGIVLLLEATTDAGWSIMGAVAPLLTETQNARED